MCLSPITRKVDCQGKSKVITHPCGKCLECVSQYQNDWANRLSDEFKQWKYAYFGTFTYSNNNLPYVPLNPLELLDDSDILPTGDGWESELRLPSSREHKFYALCEALDKIPLSDSLCKARRRNDGYTDYLKSSSLLVDEVIKVPIVSKYDIQCFIKRLRTNFERKYNRTLDMVYFCCSEYGPCTLRPHYHIIFMTNELVENFAGQVKKAYGLGEIRDFHLLKSRGHSGISDACAYTAKYCCKPPEFENPYVVAGLIPKPFRLMSKGIGLAERKDFLMRARFYNGRKYDPTNRNYYGYSSEYLDFIYNYVTHKYSLGKDMQVFQVKQPRYYSDSWFPQKDFFTPIINVHNEIVYKKSRRKNSESRLCLAYSRYVEDRYLQLCDNALRELKALYPTKTDSEIIHLAEIQRVQNVKERASKKLQNFVKFYGKSFFRGM